MFDYQGQAVGKSPYINGGASTSLGQQATGTGLLNESVSSLDVALKDLNECIELVRNLGNNLFGEVPEPATSAPLQPPPNTVSQQVRARVGWLHERIGELRAQIQRLNSL